MLDPSEQMCGMASPPTWRTQYVAWRRRAGRSLSLWLHGVWWRLLWGLRLGRPYSRLLCRLGRYYQYQPGHCGWCGEPHVALSKHWRNHPHWRPQAKL